jgi:hypothetical protein
MHDVEMKSNYIFVLKDISHLQLLKDRVLEAQNKNAIWIGINHDFPEVHDQLIEFCSSLTVSYNIICNYLVPLDIDRLDNFIKNYPSGWTFVNIAGENIAYNENVVDSYANKNNKPLALVKEGESINNMCYFNFLYVFLRGSKPEINEETEEVSFKTYEEKVYDQSASMIKTWEELNEFYSHYSNQ